MTKKQLLEEIKDVPEDAELLVSNASTSDNYFIDSITVLDHLIYDNYKISAKIFFNFSDYYNEVEEG